MGQARLRQDHAMSLTDAPFNLQYDPRSKLHTICLLSDDELQALYGIPGITQHLHVVHGSYTRDRFADYWGARRYWLSVAGLVDSVVKHMAPDVVLARVAGQVERNMLLAHAEATRGNIPSRVFRIEAMIANINDMERWCLGFSGPESVRAEWRQAAPVVAVEATLTAGIVNLGRRKLCP